MWPTTPPCKKYNTNMIPTKGFQVDLSQPPSNMITSVESLKKEGRDAKDSLLGPKAKICIGPWNVRTMSETSKFAQVLNEMRKYRLDILEVSECRWIGSGRWVASDGSVILY